MTGSQPGWTKGRREAIAREVRRAMGKARAYRAASWILDAQIRATHAADAIMGSDPAPSLYEALEKARNQVVAFALDTLNAEQAVAAVAYIDAVLASARGEQP